MKWIRRCSVCFLSIISLWLAVSFFDVITHNMSDQDYASWNIVPIFEICTKDSGKTIERPVTV